MTRTRSGSAGTDGREYESLTEIVVRELERVASVDTIELRRRARIRGHSTTHEIDVWWKLLDHDGRQRVVAFQCKDLTRPVDQGEMLKFRAVLADIPEQPAGVFVARGGYQRGAAMVAATSNIVRLVVDRTGDDELIEYEQLDVLEVQIKLHRTVEDRDEAVSESDVFSEQLEFFDAEGIPRGNLRQILEVATLRSTVPPGQEFERTHRFRQPTYVRTDTGRLVRVTSLKFQGCARTDVAFGELLVQFLHELE